MGWASDHTNGKIPKVLDEINPDIVMILMNALYFKGLWTYKFKESDSYQDSFFPAQGPAATVYFTNGLIPARLVRNEHAVAAELTYGTGNYSMVIVVPDSPLPGG
jgi:serpin B